MKKRICLLFLSALPLMLSSCRITIADSVIVFPWWWAVSAIAVFAVLKHCTLIFRHYRCPRCKHVFRPRWNEFSLWISIEKKRVLSCPICREKGFFERCKKKERHVLKE